MPLSAPDLSDHLQLFINRQPVTFRSGSLQITDKLNERSTLTVAVHADELPPIEEGNHVVLADTRDQAVRTAWVEGWGDFQADLTGWVQMETYLPLPTAPVVQFRADMLVGSPAAHPTARATVTATFEPYQPRLVFAGSEIVGYETRVARASGYVTTVHDIPNEAPTRRQHTITFDPVGQTSAWAHRLYQGVELDAGIFEPVSTEPWPGSGLVQLQTFPQTIGAQTNNAFLDRLPRGTRVYRVLRYQGGVITADFNPADAAGWGVGPFGDEYTDPFGNVWQLRLDMRREVVYEYGDGTVFEGFVANVEANPAQTLDAGRQEVLYTIDVVDNHVRADRRRITIAYSDVLSSDVVASLVTGELDGDAVPRPLGEEGVVIGEIEPTEIPIASALANFAEVDALLNALAARERFVWNIDHQRRINFHSMDRRPAGYEPGAEVGDLLEPAVAWANSPQYRNLQTVRGSRVTEADPRSEVFLPRLSGGQQQRTFTVALPIATVPTATRGGVPMTVGILGLDENGEGIYWNKGSQTLTLDDAEPDFGNNEELLITYQGQVDQLVRVIDPVGAAEVRRREDADASGTSGTIESVAGAAYDTVAEAIEEAQLLLNTGGVFKRRLRWSTDRLGLRPGEVVTVHLPPDMRGMFFAGAAVPDSARYVIEAVEVIDIGAAELIATIEAVNVAGSDAWASFWKRGLSPDEIPRNLLVNIGATDVALLFVDTVESTSADELVTMTVNACPVPAAGTYPAGGLLPC